MIVTVQRFFSNKNETIGGLFIDNRFKCFILEDEKRTVKVWGETRIPSGTYKCELRTEGKHHGRYKKRFPDEHEGMIHLLDVPNFKYILYHIGNTDEDTAGCLLPGMNVARNQNEDYEIQHSTMAYRQTYNILRDAVKAEGLKIRIFDEPLFQT